MDRKLQNMLQKRLDIKNLISDLAKRPSYSGAICGPQKSLNVDKTAMSDYILCAHENRARLVMQYIQHCRMGV